MVQVNVRVPPDLHVRLIEQATLSQTTVTAVVTQALEKFLQPVRGNK
jgi:predicted HicB family RNase H-like nuclease